MLTLIIIMGILIIILAVMLFNYQRQVKNICRQLAFLKNHDSNMLVTSNNETGGMNELKENINELIRENREHKRLYQEKESQLSETYTNLSHDIRTPLTSLEGYFELLSEAENEEDKQRYISIIKERTQCLNEILEEMFTYAKLENDSYQLELSKCNITKILKETILSYYNDWMSKGITPILSIPEQQLCVQANEKALHRVIQNIVKNVLEHGEKEIQISLSEENQDNHSVLLTVSNRVSNPEEIQVEKVFERFYKADKTRSRNSSGLGLSIAYGLVQKMKGRIYAALDHDIFSIIIEFDV